MAIVTSTTVPITSSFDNLKGASGAGREVVNEFNALMGSIAVLGQAMSSDGVLVATAISRGTTTTFSTTACTITVAGVPVVVAASANTAFTTPLTITADCWGIIAFDAIAAGTVTSTVVGPGATQAYASEAAAIAAYEAKTADKARLGYCTILTASAAAWIANTDSLAGGATGNVATTTNYYPMPSPFQLTAASDNVIALGGRSFTATQVGNLGGTAITSTNF